MDVDVAGKHQEVDLPIHHLDEFIHTSIVLEVEI
jgi:hypothetical protein